MEKLGNAVSPNCEMTGYTLRALTAVVELKCGFSTLSITDGNIILIGRSLQNYTERCNCTNIHNEAGQIPPNLLPSEPIPNDPALLDLSTYADLPLQLG